MRLVEVHPTPAQRRLGGSTPFRIRKLVRLRSFERTGVRLRVQAGMVAGARIGWIEVGLLSVLIPGVSAGIRQGKIVDSVRCLGVGLVDG